MMGWQAIPVLVSVLVVLIFIAILCISGGSHGSHGAYGFQTSHFGEPNVATGVIPMPDPEPKAEPIYEGSRATLATAMRSRMALAAYLRIL